MSGSAKLSVYLLAFLLVTAGMLVSCNAINFRSSETADQVLDKIVTSIRDYHKNHNKFPHLLTDIDNFPYEVYPAKRCKGDICRSYDIRNLDGSYIDGKYYLKLGYGITLKPLHPKFVRYMILEHNNLTCSYYLRDDGSYKKNCRVTDPSGFYQ